MNIGELLRKLRIARNFSQRKLARNITSQSSLASMEKMGNIPSSILFDLLDQLSIRPFEFFNFAQKDPIKPISMPKDEKEMTEEVNKQMGLYKKTGIWTHKINALCIRSIYCQAHGLPLLDSFQIATEVKKYLQQFDYWFINDVVIHTKMMFFFNSNFIKEHHQIVLHSIKISSLDQIQKRSYQTNYLNDVIMMTFKRRNWSGLDFYLNSYQNLLTSFPESLNDRIRLSIFNKLRELVVNYDETLYQNLLSEIQLFNTYGLNSVKKDLENFVNECLKEKT